MKNYSSRDEDFNLWVLLSQARNVIYRARQKELDRYNVSVAQVAALFCIESIGDQATPAEISRCLLRTPHSVSVVLNGMERKGLLRKVKDLDRKNMIRVVLTEKGREFIDHQSNKPKSILKIMSSLSKEERQQIRNCLKTLRDKALEDLGITGKPPFPYS